MADGEVSSPGAAETLGTDLERLLDRAEDAGLKIGPRERTAIHAVALHWLGADTGRQPSIHGLKPLITPLVARSPDERGTFDQVFNGLFPTHRSSPEPLRPPEPPQRPRWLWILLVILPVIILTGTLLLWSPWKEDPAGGTIGPTPPIREDTGAPQIRTPIVTPPTEQPAPQVIERTPDVMLNRVRDAALAFEGAPTLDEIADSVAHDEQSLDGWTAEAYSIRLSELTGLPRGVTLPIFGLDDPDGDLWARVALALARLEEPAAPHSLQVLRRQASTALEGADRPPAYKLSAVLGEVFPTPDAFPDERWDILQGINVATGKTYPNEMTRRALELAGLPSDVLAPERSDPGIRAASAPAPAWLVPLATGIPLLAALLLAGTILFNRAYLRQRPPRIPPTRADLVADAHRRVAYSAGLFQRAGQRLLTRTARPSDRLDVDATIQATLRHGGEMLEPVFADTENKPDYLVLIERSGPSDQEASRLRQLVDRLEGLVHTDILYFQTDPAELETLDGGRRMSLVQAQSSFPDHRLVILGAGNGFLDPVTREPREPAQGLLYWDRRALLTPIPLAEWGGEEYALAEALDLPIGRATPEGLLALAGLLGLEGAETRDRLDPTGDGLARPLPDILRKRPQRFLFNAPPPDATVAELVRELRNVLDPASFEWLGALAIYPSIQWDLTLYLGVELPRRPGGDPAHDPLYNEDRVAALTQLPWLRAGRMPNWLRSALIEELPPARRSEARAAIERAIEAARLKDGPDEAALRLRIGREAPTERVPPERILEDEVLLDFLSSGRREDFALPRPGEILEFIQRGLWERIGLPQGMALLTALAFAATAWMIVPRTESGAVITGAYAPLLVLVAGAVLIMALWAPARTLVLLRNGLERSAPPVVAFWFGLLGMVAVVMLLTEFFSAQLIGISSFDFSGTVPLRVSISFLTAPFLFGLGLLLGRWVGERLSLRVFVAPAASSEGRRRLIAKSFALTVAAMAWLFVTIALLDQPDEILIIWLITWLVSPFLMLCGALLLNTFSFGNQRPPRAGHIGKDHSSVPVAMARGALAAVPLLGAGLLAWHLQVTHERSMPAFTADTQIAEPTRTSVDADVFAFSDAVGRIEVRSFDGMRQTLEQASDRADWRGPLTALAATRNGRVTHLTFADRDGFLFEARTASSVRPVHLSDLPLRSAGAPALIAHDPDGQRLIVVETEAGRTKLYLEDEDAMEIEGAPGELIALGEAGFALAMLDGSLWQITAETGALDLREVETGDTGPLRKLTYDPATNTLRSLGLDGTIWTAPLMGDQLQGLGQAGSIEALALGPPPAQPGEAWSNFDAEDLEFSYRAPGDLIEESGEGARPLDYRLLPDLVFPIRDHPAFVNSAAFGPGSTAAGGDQCDARNYSYPWRDNYCETRSTNRSTLDCPAQNVSTFVNIRAGDSALCEAIRRTPDAERQQVAVVAVADGFVSNVGSFTVTLRSEGIIFRYMQLNMNALAVAKGDTVQAGDLIGYMSNDFGGTPVTIGLRFDVKVNTADRGWVSVSPYEALIEAYDRKLAEIAADKGAVFTGGRLVEPVSEPPQEPEVPLAPRLYIQINSESQREKANRLGAVLRDQDVVQFAPIELVSPANSPAVTEFRYFRQEERPLAEAVFAQLSSVNEQLGGAAIQMVFVPGFEETGGVRDNQFELWFPASVIPRPPCSTLNEEFVVYFDWDSVQLTSSGASTVDQALSNVSERSDCTLSEVSITGHTDTEGARAYNLTVSERMAATVRDALISRGVATDIITTSARGETDLAVATADGVREPLNRRVEVMLYLSKVPEQVSDTPNGVRSISFDGNDAFSDQQLRSEISTQPSETGFNPEQLEFDRELLRRFYSNRGFADFQVISVDANITPDGEAFDVIFNLVEGDVYMLGEIEVETSLEDLDAEALRVSLPVQELALYQSDLIEDSIDALNFAAGAAGYAFVDVVPRFESDTEANTVDITFVIEEGAKDYIEDFELTPGTTFRDTLMGGGQGPEMVVVPAGSFMMGSPEDELGRFENESPLHEVRIGSAFAVGAYEVTWVEWAACVAGGGCDGYTPGDEGWGKGWRPVINVSWEDAQAYASWLSDKTGERYRLLTEAEWEYAARAGTQSAYAFGDEITTQDANFNGDNYIGSTVPVGLYRTNGFGLHDMHGNVWEWVEDCYQDSYIGASADGSARQVNNCSRRVVRGGSWDHSPQDLRSADRVGGNPAFRNNYVGFRVARTL